MRFQFQRQFRAAGLDDAAWDGRHVCEWRVACTLQQRRLHRDVTNLQIGRDVEYEDDWDFPDRQGTEDAKEADDDEGGAGA